MTSQTYEQELTTEMRKRAKQVIASGRTSIFTVHGISVKMSPTIHDSGNIVYALMCDGTMSSGMPDNQSCDEIIKDFLHNWQPNK